MPLPVKVIDAEAHRSCEYRTRLSVYPAWTWRRQLPR